MRTVTFTDEEFELITTLPDAGGFQEFDDGDFPEMSLASQILETRIMEEHKRHTGIYCDECVANGFWESPMVASGCFCKNCGNSITKVVIPRDFSGEIASLSDDCDDDGHGFEEHHSRVR